MVFARFIDNLKFKMENVIYLIGESDETQQNQIVDSEKDTSIPSAPNGKNKPENAQSDASEPSGRNGSNIKPVESGTSSSSTSAPGELTKAFCPIISQVFIHDILLFRFFILYI